ncbi:hypothetical protein MMYC01_206643 [Madurella mycetomatis]|uniref:DUF3669 domain-containing protein n=1 Tax=Madurella mycetomatis TaxID=100816 RepID=A0A175VZ21_9PEZI|nr:hypothetical protein MMYC01_206643 [Madurella mycetomatis]
MNLSLPRVVLQNLTLEDRLESEASSDSPEKLLKRMLSVRSVVSTDLSFARRQQAAAGTKAMFREIGTASIGKVFEHPGTIFVYKLPITDQPQKLWNNYTKHMRVYRSFKSLPYTAFQVEIPRCFWYATPSTAAFWNDYLQRFPDLPQFPRLPRHALCMERIFPLPRAIRHALVDKYCPPQARQSMKENQSNKDCLIHPCLGRIKYGAGGHFFNLRNFKLHANEVKDLDLPVSELYVAMSHALAVLHWHTKVDGMDVEFVFGSSPAEDQMIRAEIDPARMESLLPQTSTYEETTHSHPDFTKQTIALWMIDFDDCNDISMDSSGVDRAVKAFLDTNFYCPRPSTGEEYIETLWKSFAESYIKHSDRILDEILHNPGLRTLPREFIRKTAAQLAARRQESRAATPATSSVARPHAPGVGVAEPLARIVEVESGRAVGWTSNGRSLKQVIGGFYVNAAQSPGHTSTVRVYMWFN